jgi:hypothetical protein
MLSLIRDSNRSIIFFIILLFFSGCSSIHVKRIPTSTTIKLPNLSEHERLRLLNAAKGALGKSQLIVRNKRFRNDCSGTIRAIFAQAQIGLGGIIKTNRENDVKAIYRYIQRYGKIVKTDPLPGDLVFFHNTYDRSGNGHMNDALTHIGIVEKVDNATVYFIHHLGQSIIRSRMNLKYRDETFHPHTKDRVNHVLRKAQGPYRAYTAAELFAGFGRL